MGRLTRVARDGRQVTYTYDASGARTSRSVDGQITERYLWASPTQLLATFDASGALTARFLYADARSPYAVETSAGVLALAYDQVGSVRAIADGSGTVLREVSYDSFGQVTSDSATGALVPLGFAGGLADPDTGLVLFGARDYEPESGRWMAKDPIGFAGGDTNLYAYCGGDPVNYVDPSGLFTVAVYGEAAITVGAKVFGRDLRKYHGIRSYGWAIDHHGMIAPVSVGVEEDAKRGDEVRGSAMLFRYSGSVNLQVSADADSVCDLAGPADYYGADLPIVPAGGGAIRGEHMEATEISAGLSMPSVHWGEARTEVGEPRPWYDVLIEHATHQLEVLLP